MQEIWKDIQGYEGLYQVSNIGRIKRLPGRVWNGKSFANKRGGIIKQMHTRGNYLFVTLCKDNVGKQSRVNRIVAAAFITNANGFPQVGHEDDNRENNNADNLYWTNAMENDHHGDRIQRIANKVGKPIVGQLGDKTIKFRSSIDAGRNGFNASAIRNCLIGLSKTHKGYTWNYF